MAASSIDQTLISPSLPAVIHPLWSGARPRLQHSPFDCATCVSMQCCDAKSQTLMSESLLVVNRKPAWSLIPAALSSSIDGKTKCNEVIWSVCPRSLKSPTSATKSHRMISVSLDPLARRTPALSKASWVMADLWPLKEMMTVAVLESQMRMLPSSYLEEETKPLSDIAVWTSDSYETTYPTAKISSSVLLCVIAVTCALHEVSRHLPSSSPFFTSQLRTSSLAPTKARPAPVLRAAPESTSSRAQIAFDDADVTSPKVFECSNFLHKSVLDNQAITSNNQFHLQV